MEYYLCRAIEVNRLREDEISRLFYHEKIKCLMPYEIQEIFGKITLKEEYGIPEKDVAQSAHNQRLRAELKKLDIAPIHGDISPLDVEAIHAFDIKLKRAVENGQANLHYSGGVGNKRTRDEFEDR